MNRKKYRETIYLFAFALWMALMFLRLTYFRGWVQIGEVTKIVQHIVIALLVVKFVLNPDLSFGGIAKLALLVLFMFAAYSYGKLPFAVSLALVFSARDVSFEKILKCALGIQLTCVVITIVCSQVGVLEDYIWDAGRRDRHGLGFTHCLLGSHFVFFMSLMFVALKKKMKWWMTVVILAANYVMYLLTDARTTMILTFFLIVAAFVAGLLEKTGKTARWAAILSAGIPLVFFGVSFLGAKCFSWQSEKMVRVNLFFNGRLDLMNKALNEYGITLLGQKIKWVGEANLKADPTLVYNYVDNAYMQAFFTYGIVFVLLLCLGWGMVLYRQMRCGQYVMAAVVLAVLIHGLINPQMIELVYNPFFLLIGKGEKHYERR